MNLDTPAATVATRIEPAADPGLAATFHAGQAAADGLTIVRGSLVGRYVVLERIGAGAMGVVFAAYDPELDRKVALKFLRADNADPEARTRLLREAQAMARLAHPNVVAVHDVGTYGGEVFVAMEFVLGVTLRHWLAGHPRGWRETVAVFVAAGRGLAAAHEAGLVHRDLKPENIMMGADERVRVMDFGLARESGRDDGEPPPGTPSREQALALELTRTGALVGTPAYMAPEQWERQESDARSDQFSFCVALWEALYGERPFRGETLAALMLAVTGGRPRAPGDSRRAPGWARRLLERGLSTDPAARWPSMAALLAELTQDRRTALRRWSAASVGIVALLAAGLGAQQVLEKRAAADAERERAERAETDAAVAHARAGREAFERAAMAEAQRSGEVLRLATTVGRERDALVLGVQVLAPFGPSFDDAPRAAIDGLARALPAMLPIMTLTHREPPVYNIALAPDGSQVAVNLWGKGVQIWSTEPARLLRTIPLEADGKLTISPDNRTLATFDYAGCFVADAQTGATLLRLPSCDDLRFSTDGTKVFVRTEGQPGRVAQGWNLADGASLWGDSVAFPRPFELAVHPDGEHLVLAVTGGIPQMLEIASGRVAPLKAAGLSAVRWQTEAGYDRELALSRTGRFVALVGFTADEEVVVIDTRTGRSQRIQQRATSVGFSGDEQRLVLADQGFVEYRRSLDGEPLWRRERAFGNDYAWPLLSAGGDVLVTDGLRLMPSQAPLLQQSMPYPLAIGQFTTIASSSEAPYFATVSALDAILWDARDPLEVRRWTPPPGEIVTYVEPEWVTTQDPAGVLRVHDRRGDRPPVRLAGVVAKDEHAIAWHADGGIWQQEGFASWRSSEGSLRYHDGDTGAETYRLDRMGMVIGLTSRVTAVSAERAAVVASAGDDGGVEVLDLPGPRPRCIVPGDGARISEVRLSDDGEHVAVLRTTGELSLWSTQPCALRIALDLDRGPTWVQSLEFAGSAVLVARMRGRTVVVGQEGVVRLDVVDPCVDHFRGGFSLASPDGRHLLTSCASPQRLGDASIWDLETRSRVATFDLAGYGWMGGTFQRPLRMLRSGDAMMARTVSGHLARIDLPDGEESLRIYTRAPVHEFWPHDDGEYVDVVDEISGALHTYPATRAGLFRSACEALARTEVAAAAAEACAPRRAG